MVFFAVTSLPIASTFPDSWAKYFQLSGLMAISLESNEIQSFRLLPAVDATFPVLDFVEYCLIAVRYLRLKLRKQWWIAVS